MNSRRIHGRNVRSSDVARAVLWAIAGGLVMSAAALSAQDMPLSDVLIDGEGWTIVAEGCAFTDAAATDAYGGFYFADVARGDTIERISADGTRGTFAKNAHRISGMQFGPDGKLYACQGGDPGRIVAFDAAGNREVIVEGLQPNDLVVTAKGGIYVTETGKSQVTYIAPGGLPVKAGAGPAKPNGIALSPDQETLAVSDYEGEHVWVWRIAGDGTLEFSQPYMTMRLPGLREPSRGDGMATDAAGRYYVTSAVGLQMFDPTGRMGGVILGPQAKPLVSVEFSGPELRYLYVCNGDKIYRRKTKSQGVLYFEKP
jgi:enterochelin esterase family protein